MKNTQNDRDGNPLVGMMRVGTLCGLMAGLGLAAVFLVFNPIFLDSPGSLVFYLLFLPALCGLFDGLLVGILCLIFRGRIEKRFWPCAVGASLLVLGAVMIPAFLLGLGLSAFGGPLGSLITVLLLAVVAGIGLSWLLTRGLSDQKTPIRRLGRRFTAMVTVSLVLFLVIWGVSAFFRAPPHDLTGQGPRLMVIGLDGASPIVIDKMVAHGELPTFAGVIEEGCYGEFKSLEPMFSPMIWATMTTGKMPEKHGVKDFLNASYLDIKVNTLWEILEARGHKVGLYEWLSTWPPAQINGFVVPGWLARNTLTYPPTLRFIKELKMAGREGSGTGTLRLARNVVLSIRHGVRLSTVTGLGKLFLQEKVFHPERKEVHYKKYLNALAMDCDIFEYLLATEKPDFVFYYHQTIDPICHLYWEDYHPELFENNPEDQNRQFGPVIELVYQEVDRYLGRLLERLGPETTLFVLSDHGFQAVTEAPESGGLLVTIRAEPLLETLGIDGLEGFHTNANLFITTQEGHTGEADQLLAEAVEKIGRYWIPDVDMPLFIPTLMDNPGQEADYVRVRLNADLREPFLHGHISQEGTTVRYSGGESILGDLVWRKYQSGVHHMDGILMVRGEGIKRGYRLPKGASRVQDLAPTLLATLGMPVARDMDGNVLHELFEPGRLSPDTVQLIDSYDPEMVKRPIVGQEPGQEAGAGEDEMLRDQLKSLGYLDE